MDDKRKKIDEYFNKDKEIIDNLPDPVITKVSTFDQLKIKWDEFYDYISTGYADSHIDEKMDIFEKHMKEYEDAEDKRWKNTMEEMDYLRRQDYHG